MIDSGAGYQDGGAPVVTTPPEPEKAAEQPKKQEPEKPKGSPLTALVQERVANREAAGALQGELQSLRQELAELKQQQPEQQQEFKNPHDPVESPMEHIKAEITALRADLTQAKQDVGARLQADDQQRALAEYEQGISAEIQLAASSNPELAQASQFLAQTFAQLAQAQGAKGAEIGQRARMALLQGYLTKASEGVDAVTATAQMALALGYQSPEAQPMPETTPAPTPAQRGQAAAEQSLGGATGGAGVSPAPDIHAVSRMSRRELTRDNRAGLNRIKEILRGNA